MNKNKKIFIITLTFLMLIGLTTITASNIESNDTTIITDTAQTNTIDTTTETNSMNYDTISTNEASTRQPDNIQEHDYQETLNDKTGIKTQNLKASRTVTATNYTNLNSYLTSDAYDTLTININNNIQLAGNITVNNSIKTLTINGNGKTINGNNQYRFLYINHPININIKNITITQCNSTSSGGAIYGSTKSNITITNSNFRNNYANNSGGAIYGSGNITITNSNLTNNNVTFSGGAIRGNNITIKNTNFSNNRAYEGGTIYGSGNITITNSYFTNSNASFGGIIYGYSNSNITVTNSNLTNSKASSTGGAIYVYKKGNLTVKNSNLTNNNGSYGGGAIGGSTNSTITVTNSTLANNYASIYGGAIYADTNSTITVTNSNLTNNYGKDTGGAIHGYINNNITVTNSTLTNNNATYGGGAISGSTNSNITVTSSNIINNTATKYGGAIYTRYTNCNILVTNSNLTNNNASEHGGAIYINGNITVKNSNLTNNKVYGTEYSSGGGAIYLNGSIIVSNSNFENNTINQKGGAIYGYYYSNITVTNSNFTKNNAKEGGAIYGFPNSTLNVTNSNFTNNNVTDSGGAIYGYTNNSITVTSSNFTNNSANFGGAIHGYLNCTTTVNNSNFIYNNANRVGGAIYGNTNSTTIITYSNFTKNNATRYGGAIYANGNLTLKNSNITDNYVIEDTGYVVDLNNVYSVIITDNTFINNTNNVRDMLFSDIKTTATLNIQDNIYTDNFLKSTIIKPYVTTVTDDEYRPYNYSVDVNLRSIYNDKIHDGTLRIFINGVLKDTTDVVNGRSRIIFENSDLTKRENNITLEYISPNKDYQNTSTTFTLKKEINTTLTIQAPSNMIAGDTAVINFTLKDADNNPISNEPIRVLVDEQHAATVTTDENGIATYTYTASGDEVVRIEATHHTSSDSFYLSSRDAVAEINVTKIEQEMIIVPGNITPHVETNITIHLFDNEGNPIKNKTLTVNITEEGKPNITGTAKTDENGIAIFNFTPTDEGTLNITVTSPEDEIYRPKTESIQVSVNFTTTNMILTATDTMINKTNTINIEILPTDGALLSGTVELNISGEIHTLNINNGRGTYHNYKSDTAGSKNITAKFTSNTPGYANVTTKEPFNVTKLPTRVTLETLNNTAGNVTLKVLVFPENNTGSTINGGNLVIESINGENRIVIYNNTLKNGELIYLTDINETGWYEFETEYHGNDYFLGEVNNTGSIEITLVSTDTTTFDKNALVGETITLNATVTDENKNPVNDGNVTFHIDGSQLYHADGTPVEAKLENGIATTEYTLPTTYTKGKYLITAKYPGNNKYNTSTGDSELSIETHETTMDVTTVNNTKGNTTIEVTLNTTDDKPIPNAPITVTDENGTIIGEGFTDENGTANITIDIPVGDNNITIIYSGDDTHNPQNETVTVNVTPRESDTTGTVTNNTVGNVTIDVQVVDPETGEPVTGPVKIIIDDEVVGNGTLDEEGKVTIPVDIDTKGNYTITVEYEGNDDYKGSNYTIDDVSIVGKDVDVDIVVDNQTVGNTTVNVTITDPETDEPIPNGTVIVTLPNGTTVNGTTDENGTVTIPIDVPVGNNNITITYPGDDEHEPQNETITVNVTPRESQTTGTIINNTAGNVTIDVEVIDPVTGEPVTGPVKIIIDDEIVGTGDLDENGTATIPVDIDKKGNYTIIVEYEGNNDYNGSTYVINDTYIKGKDVNITTNTDNPTVGNTTVNLTITDPETNEPIPNATIIITLPNGTTVNGTTDENGTINITIDIPSGDNNITITYPGDDEHETQQENITIRVKSYTIVTVNPVEGVTLDNVTFTANVRDYQDNPVTGGYVQFSVGGKTLKDENGKNIKVLVENGTAKLSYKAESGWIVDSHPNLKVQAVFTGTSLARENRSDTNKVTIYKRNATIEISAPDDYVNGTLHIDAIVKDQNGSFVNDGVLVFKINGLSLKDENNKGIVAQVVNGKVHLDVKLPFAYSAKKYNLTATYSNKIYNKASGTNTTTLKAIPTYINATVTIKDQFSKPVVTGQIYNKFNNAVLEGTAIINIKFDGISYAKKVKIQNGTFTETLEGIPIYKPGTHKIEIAAGANSHYEAARKTITSKTTPKYNVNTQFINITRNKTTTRVQAKIVDDKNKNVQRDLRITIKLNGKSFLVNKTVTNGIVDVLIDTSTLKNRNYTLELVSGANTYYNAGKATTELPKY